MSTHKFKQRRQGYYWWHNIHRHCELCIKAINWVIIKTEQYKTQRQDRLYLKSQRHKHIMTYAYNYLPSTEYVSGLLKFVHIAYGNRFLHPTLLKVMAVGLILWWTTLVKSRVWLYLWKRQRYLVDFTHFSPLLHVKWFIFIKVSSNFQFNLVTKMVNNHESLSHKWNWSLPYSKQIDVLHCRSCLFKLKCPCMTCEAHLQPKLLIVKDRTVQEIPSLQQIICVNGVFKTWANKDITHPLRR